MNTHETDCPAWCTQHRHIPEGQLGAHQGWLFSSYPTLMPPEDRRRPVVALSLGQILSDGEDALHEPSMALSVFGQEPPAGVDAKEARALAAALIRGAEIAEGYLTEACRTCGGGTTPHQAASSGQCFNCEVDARTARRASMKASLRTVSMCTRRLPGQA